MTTHTLVKRWLALGLACLMLLSFAACKKQTGDSTKTEKPGASDNSDADVTDPTDDAPLPTDPTDGAPLPTDPTYMYPGDSNSLGDYGGNGNNGGNDYDDNQDSDTIGSTTLHTTKGYYVRPSYAPATRPTTTTSTRPSDPNVLAERTATIAQLYDEGILQPNGRYQFQDSGAMYVAYNNAGFTIEGTMKGKVSVTVIPSKMPDYPGGTYCRITVVVDGDTANAKTVEAPYATSSVIDLCDNLAEGHHVIEVSKSTAWHYCTLQYLSLTYTGRLVKPAEKKLQMEFIGDSITCGEGMYNVGGNTPQNHNSFYSYAALTARKLNAGLQVESYGGSTSRGMRTRFNDSSWSFEPAQKDIVVINLGTNDFSQSAPANWLSEFKGLISDVRAKYGPDTYIIWAYGMMSGNGINWIENSVINAYREENNDNRVLWCNLIETQNMDGVANHPDAAHHEQAADLLTQFIRTHCSDVLG